MRFIVFAHHRTGVAGHQVVEAVLVSGLHQLGWVAQANFVQQAHTQRVAAMTCAQQVGVGGKGHDEFALAAVGFGHRDRQVAAIAGGEQVIEHKGARSHRDFVDQYAALAHGDPRIGLGNASHHGGKAGLGVR